MLRNTVLEIIENGENSGIEFKHDDIRPEQLAKEIVALANFSGGRILIGVEDDGTVSGIRKKNCEEWVMSVFREKVHPMILPFYEEVRMDGDVRIAVISFPQGISKPYVVRHKGREDVYIRTGSTSRLATREQQARLFATGGMVHTELMPVPGTNAGSLDRARLENYLRDIIRDPEVPVGEEQWRSRLMGLGLLVDTGLGEPVCTVAGLVIFGIAPRRNLPQSGLRLMAFDGPDTSYRAKLDTVIDAPLAGRYAEDRAGGRVRIDEGLIDRAAAAIRPFIEEESDRIDENMRRPRRLHYPWEAVRETVVNALAHRDWTRTADIEIRCYADRLEVLSPGALQNSMTVEKMRSGLRSPRNPLIVDIMRDYGYVDARGMGIRTKVIPLMMEHNNTDPLYEAAEDYMRTVLYRGNAKPPA